MDNEYCSNLFYSTYAIAWCLAQTATEYTYLTYSWQLIKKVMQITVHLQPRWLPCHQWTHLCHNSCPWKDILWHVSFPSHGPDENLNLDSHAVWEQGKDARSRGLGDPLSWMLGLYLTWEGSPHDGRKRFPLQFGFNEKDLQDLEDLYRIEASRMSRSSLGNGTCGIVLPFGPQRQKDLPRWLTRGNIPGDANIHELQALGKKWGTSATQDRG